MRRRENTTRWLAEPLPHLRRQALSPHRWPSAMARCPGRCRCFPPTTGGTRTSRRRRWIRGPREFIAFIGPADGMHPDFGGTESPGSQNIYGMPYVVVGADQAKVAVEFDYADESDGVNHQTGQSYPFYPIPEQAITEPYWIEGGPPGNANVERRPAHADRRSRQPAPLRALCAAMDRLAVGGRVRRVLRPEHQRPAAGGLDVGGCGRARDPARARPLRRGVRARRDPPCASASPCTA